VGLFAPVLFLAALGESSPLEEAARRVERQLMAPCCFSQPVADHHSPVAEEMRRQIRTALAAGAREEEVLAAFARVYGDRILAEPPARGFDRLVHVVPLLALACGVVGLTVALRRWHRAAQRSEAKALGG